MATLLLNNHIKYTFLSFNNNSNSLKKLFSHRILIYETKQDYSYGRNLVSSFFNYLKQKINSSKSVKASLLCKNEIMLINIQMQEFKSIFANFYFWKYFFFTMNQQVSWLRRLVTNVKQIWISVPNGFLLIANIQAWSGTHWLNRTLSHPHTWRSITRMYGLTDIAMTGVGELPNCIKCLNTRQTISLKIHINNNIFHKLRDPPSVVFDRANLAKGCLPGKLTKLKNYGNSKNYDNPKKILQSQ